MMKRRTTFVMGQITLDDALNDPDPLSFDPPARASLTCRVCDRTEDVPILTAGLLCALCRADLDATERHIQGTLAAAELRFKSAVDAWDTLYNQADPEDQARYQNVCEARAAASTGFAGKYQRALDKGDGLSVLLKAKSACDDVAKGVQGKLAVWAERALEEVREARDA